MGRVAAIGAPVRVDGLALAGVLVLAAESDAEVRARWAALPEDVAVVLLTPQAASALPSDRPADGSPRPLTVVMPP